MEALLYFVAASTTFGIVESCLVRMKTDDAVQNIWDVKNFKRKIDESCDCGKFDPDNWSTPWNLYIHVKDDMTMTDKTCVGTIIASNLVVTSHKCLLLAGQKAHLYDVLKLKMKGINDIAQMSMIRITDTKNFEPDTVEFNVTDVIHNPQYVRSSQFNMYPENDLVLIKVNANFLAHPNHSPICVPDYDSESLGNVTGFYYGYTPTEKDENDTENRPRRLFGEILDKRQCYKDLNVKKSPDLKERSFGKTLCFKFSVLDKHSKIEGGPLIYNFNPSSTENHAFLFGVSTVIVSGTGSFTATGYEVSTGQENAYFSSMRFLARFIGYYTTRGGNPSVWCKTPKLKQKKMDMSKRDIFDDSSETIWPWDVMNTTLRRDESLDCVCGIKNNQRSAGRIVGGEEAVPREFGWMAQMSIYPNGKKKGGSLCGGAIINDRLILTAAHCLVMEEWIEDKHRQVSVDPSNIQLQLNAHYRKNDKHAMVKGVASVLFHPKYFYARKDHSHYDTDIALLVLKEPLTFPKEGPGLRPVCLPRRGTYMEVVGKDSWVAGWGKTDPTDDGSAANALQKIKLPIIDIEQCRSKAANRITDNFLCAGTINRWHDAAAGDSGGPLMIEDDGQWYEIGIVSWGEDIYGSDSETVALYSDVQKLLPFVDYHARRVHARWCKMSKS